MKKQPKTIVTDRQAELIQELARAQAALAKDTLEMIRELREAHAYVMQVRKFIFGNACTARAKLIPFPTPPSQTPAKTRSGRNEACRHSYPFLG